LRPWIWSVFLGIPAVVAAAPTIYKSVDEKGRVTYSSEPTQDAVQVEEVKTSPAPPEEAGNAADRTRSMMDMARELEEGRLEKEKLRADEKREQQRIARENEQFERQKKLLDEMERYNQGWVRGRYWPYPPVATPLPSVPIVPAPSGGKGFSPAQ
jgi:hypothetical protein